MTRVLCALLFFAAAGCGLGPSPLPSIVLISIDTLRADHLSCYGYDRPTPSIDSLAALGVLYENAHASAPWTLPSHVSLFTGLYPSSHGVVDTDRSLPPAIAQLPEALKRHGYRTAGFGAHIYLGRNFGFGRGFDHYEITPYRNDPQEISRGDRIVTKGLQWLDSRKADPRPFFLFLHIFDPHWAYAAPEPWIGKYSSNYVDRMDGSLPALTHFIDRPMPGELRQHAIDLYDEEVAWTDALIGRLMLELKARSMSPMVVLVADHGEEFKEHGSMGHAVTLYKEQTHVPLIIVDPEGEQGQRVAAPVRTIDLVPTLAERVGIPSDDPIWQALEGASLDRVDPERPVVIETTRWGSSRSAVLLGDQKAISPSSYHWLGHWRRDGEVVREPVAHFEREAALYDLAADPNEATPLPWDPRAPAALALEDWQERTWRGIRVEMRIEKGLEAFICLHGDIVWRDQAKLDDGIRTLPVPIEGSLITLSNLPAGRNLRLDLPLEPTQLDSLEIEVSGDVLWIRAGKEEERRLTAGGRWTIAASDPGDHHRGLPEGEAAVSRISVRTRSFEAVRAASELSEHDREVLRSLGYVDG
ncbi:MAG: hypothetical protein CME06_09740 [Gemmatimonadetes bacterium]|nr:hypothetical protein [Gemmatimonadota bacterium]